MSLAVPSSPRPFSLELPGQRKRTCSFSCSTQTSTASPRPAKAPRLDMGSLQRSESYTSLSDLVKGSSSSASSSSPRPHSRSLRHYKEQRERRKALIHQGMDPSTLPTDTFTTPPEVIPEPVPKVAAPVAINRQPQINPPTFPCSFRTSSPLAPMRTILPARPVFPRSKPEPDLYRQAITTRLRGSPEGKKILHMGPRLAISIMAATKELEQIVAAQQERQGTNDVIMEDGTGSTTGTGLSNSWVVVPGEDWEMVDCAA